MKNKKLIIINLMLALGLLASAGASAQTMMPGNTLAPMVTQIDQSGNALVRGIVQSTGANSITIQGWDGTWTINTTANTTITPTPATAGDMSGIQVGDFVGAQGRLSGQGMNLNADFVRNWTQSSGAMMTPPQTPPSTEPQY